MTVTPEHFPLLGSLDLSTAPMLINPGDAIECLNFAPGLNGGYRYIGGYERFDGRPAPSAARFWALEVDDSDGLAVGETITGDSSGATAVIIALASEHRVVVTELQGGYSEGETANGVTITGIELIDDADTESEFDDLKYLAAEHYRAQIDAVPGSGPVRGVFRHLDATYACRDNADGTECVIHKASVSGWQPLALHSVIRFKDGISEISEGDTITGSSGTAVVLRVLITKGAWSGDAEGYLVIELQSGTLQDGATLKVGAVTCATSTSAAEQIRFQPGGRFEFTSHNFKGSDDGYRVYGCDGVNPAFEVDQTGLLAPLYSKDEADNPLFLQVHRDRLFLGFKNGQVQYTVAGEPWNFTVALGAGQIGLGAEVTGMLPQSGGVLALTTRRRTFILQGSSNADFQLTVAAETAGAYPYTLQSISEAFALDDRGIIQLSRTAAFGGFESGSVTRKIQKLIDRLKHSATASTVIRRFNQYWLFFENGMGLACYPVNTANGMAFRVTQLHIERPVRCICNAEDEAGAERIFFGSDDGFVYELERGTSFDGAEIEAFVRLPFNHFRSPRIRKRWRKFILELEPEGPVSLHITPDRDYSSPDVVSSATQQIFVHGGKGGYWDTSEWDLFNWDTETVFVPEMQLTGTGQNIGFLIHHQSAKTRSFTLQSVLIHYEMRRLAR